MKRRDLAALLLAALAATGLRAAGLQRSLGHDEAYTLEVFAAQPVTGIVTSYAAPNNHILHTLLVRLSVQVLGREPWAVRLPAFVAGVTAIPVVYFVGRALLGGPVGLVAAWALAMNPLHTAYSQSARGYSLLVLLVLLSLLFARQALVDEGRGAWIGFAVCGFLAAWTVPSGAFHLLALVGWTLLLAPTPLRRRALLAGGLASAGILLAYLPMHTELAAAAARWGVDTRQDPLAPARVLGRAATAWCGGWSGVGPVAAAVGGAVCLVRERRDAALYGALAWVAPAVAGLLMGTMGQPRAYTYLLPSFVVAAAYGVCRVGASTTVRATVAAGVLAGWAWGGARTIGVTPGDPYADLASHLRTETAAGDLLVTPFIMDTRLWPYARDTIGERLLEAAAASRVERLLFVASSAEERFQLPSYLLKTNAGPAPVVFAPKDFDQVYWGDVLSLWQLRSTAQRLYPVAAQTGWRIPAPVAGHHPVRVAPGKPAFSSTPSIDVNNPAELPFQVYSATRFATHGAGVVVLIYAASSPQAYVSLYRVNAGRVERPHLFRTAAWPVVARGRDRELWHVDAYLLPLASACELGLYLLGDAPFERFADVTCLFFPYPG